MGCILFSPKFNHLKAEAEADASEHVFEILQWISNNSNYTFK